MTSINPYLNFNGNTEEAFNFYKSVFGGDFTVLQRFKDIPGSDKMAADEQDKILHVSLPIGEGTVLMASDAVESMGKKVDIGSNFHISVNTGSEEEANKLFTGLSMGGTVTMPIAKTFWNSYFGMLTDKFGVQWMVSYEYNK
jgi:PhnB protein